MQPSGDPTCAHCDGFNELVSPAVGSNQQGQVGFLYQFVHCVLPNDRKMVMLVQRYNTL